MNIYIWLLFLFFTELLVVFFLPGMSTVFKIGNDKQFVVKNIYAKLFIFFDIFLLSMITIFRNKSVGTDYSNYIYMLDRLNKFSFSDLDKYQQFYNIEYGFILLEKIILQITNEKLIVILLCTLIMMIGLKDFINKYSYNAIFSMYLFLTFSFFNQSLNIMRQYIAVLLALYLIKCAKENDLKKFIMILIMLCFFVHKSVIVLLCLYPIANYMRNIKRVCIWIIAFFAVTSLFSSQIISLGFNMLGYEKYLTRYEGELGIGILINILIFLVYYIFYEQFKDYDSNANIWLFMSAMTVGLNFLAADFSLMSRIILYFKVCSIVSIPNFICSFNKKSTQLGFNIIAVVLFALYYLYTINASTCYDTVPYTSDILNILN